MAVRLVADLLSGEHHGHVDVAGQVRQPFGVTGIGEACEMERVLVGRGGDDGIHLAAEGELDGGFDRVAGDATRPQDAITVLIPLAAAEAPRSYSDFTLTGNRRDLLFRANNRDLGIDCSASARAAISGPMPRGSPSVMASLGPDLDVGRLSQPVEVAADGEAAGPAARGCLSRTSSYLTSPSGRRPVTWSTTNCSRLPAGRVKTGHHCSGIGSGDDLGVVFRQLRDRHVLRFAFSRRIVINPLK